MSHVIGTPGAPCPGPRRFPSGVRVVIPPAVPYPLGHPVRTVNGVLPDEHGDIRVSDATATERGLMSAEDKAKLDGVEAGAEVNVVETVKVDGAALVPDEGRAVDIDLTGKADKATTLAGYGITDARIADGTIILGSDSITPLTAHQDITGKADLVDGKVPASQLPSYVDDVLEFPATTDFPATGETGKIYVATSTGKVYRWSGSQYIEIANPDLSGYVTDDDPRLSDARTPTAHKSSHATGGSDAIAPSDIGAAASSHTHSASDITSGLATVATSGAYSDLSGKPTIPAIPTPVAPASATASGQFADALATKSELAAKVALEEFSSGPWSQDSSYSSGDKVFYDGFLYLCSSDVSPTSTPPSEDPTHWDQVSVSYLMFLKADASSLAAVATSGSYNDLTNKPTIPAAQVNADWNAASGVAQILNKPTIPTVPTNVSAFTNDAGYVTTAALRYDLPTNATAITTASQETVGGETVNYGAATLADRTGNRVSITAALDELRVTFPPAVSGKLRDFGLRVEVGTGSAALTAPALVPVAPTGETIKLENNAKQIPALADGTAEAKGVTLLYFSESAPGVFFAKGEQVGEVA